MAHLPHDGSWDILKARVLDGEKKYYDLLERHEKFRELVITESLALWKKIK